MTLECPLVKELDQEMECSFVNVRRFEVVWKFLLYHSIEQVAMRMVGEQ